MTKFEGMVERFDILTKPDNRQQSGRYDENEFSWNFIDLWNFVSLMFNLHFNI